jgi:hypothetical protein
MGAVRTKTLGQRRKIAPHRLPATALCKKSSKQPLIGSLAKVPSEWRAENRVPLSRLKRPVVVAMIAMGMVQVSADQVVGVIAMRNSLVPASRTMYVLGFVSVALMTAGARIEIF